jgi:hypothetical protein
MKKVIVVATVLVLLAMSSMPALAAGGHHGNGPHGPKAFVVSGTIVALDTTAGTVTIQVDTGNKAVKREGQQVTVYTNGDTRYYRKIADQKPQTITFAELAVGQKVSVEGTVANDNFTARKVTVWGGSSPAPEA